MESKFTKASDKIFIGDWLKLKPYEHHTSYDLAMLEHCRQVHVLIEGGLDVYMTRQGLGISYRKKLACTLVSYFEDYISHIGLWRVFQQRNQTLYGQYIPLIELSETYDPEYMQMEDIQYLIWHYLSRWKPEVIYPIASPLIIATAISIADYLKAAIKQTPATDYYESWMTFQSGQPFKEIKRLMGWFSVDSWLLGEDQKAVSVELMKHTIAQIKNHPMDVQMKLMYAAQDEFMYQQRSSFAGLNTVEWIAGAIRAPEDVKTDVYNLQYQHNGTFELLQEDAVYAHMRSLSTNQLYAVLLNSVYSKTLFVPMAQRTGIRTQLVRWNNEWIITGGTVSLALTTADEREEQKTIVPFWMNPPDTQALIRSQVIDMEQAFVDFFGSHLSIFPSDRAFQTAQSDFFNYYNARFGIGSTEAEKKAAEVQRLVHLAQQDNIRNDGNLTRSFSFFMEAGAGLTVVENIHELIGLLHKAAPLTDEETVYLFSNMLKNTEPALANYLLANFPTHNYHYPVKSDKLDLPRWHDYLQRFSHPHDTGGVVFPRINAM